MIDAPPAIYDHPYQGQVIEMVMKAPQVNSLCLKIGAIDPPHHGVQFLGCAWKDSSARCYIVISEHAYIAIKQHEIARCNGWPGDHSSPPSAERKP